MEPATWPDELSPKTTPNLEPAKFGPSGVAMNCGADLAKVRADAVLLSDAPGDLVAALRIARRTHSVIRQNLMWALGYNLVVLRLAVTGHLSPLVAGLGMSASSLLVVVNSLRAR